MEKMNGKLLVFCLLFGIATCFLYEPSRVVASPVNVALDSSVTASHDYNPMAGHFPENLVDGNWNTVNQIYSNGQSCWWQFNLANAQRIDWIRFVGMGNHPNYATYKYNYTFLEYIISYRLYETDPWTPIVHYTGSSQTETIYSNEFILDTPVFGQYFKLDALDYNYGNAAWRELELYQEPGGTMIPEPASVTLFCLWMVKLYLKKKQ